MIFYLVDDACKQACEEAADVCEECYVCGVVADYA